MKSSLLMDLRLIFIALAKIVIVTLGLISLKYLCEVISKEREVMFTGHRTMDNCYAIDPSSKTSLVCSRAKFSVIELWHRSLGYINYRDLIYIANKDLVRGIPKLSGQPKSICGECMKGKQVKGSHKNIQGNSTFKPLGLLHLELIGPMHSKSKDGMKYVLVVVDDFSRYSFLSFLRENFEIIRYLKSLFY